MSTSSKKRDRGGNELDQLGEPTKVSKKSENKEPSAVEAARARIAAMKAHIAVKETETKELIAISGM